jgi:hypothetical protein
MKKKNEDWTALYLPSCDGGESPTCGGFKTPEKAERYSQQYWCKSCREQYAKFLKWKKNGSKPYFEDWFDEKIKKVENYNKMSKNDQENLHIDLDIEFMNLYGDSSTSCGAEWLVVETKKLKNCKNFGDVMDAVGAKRIK